VPWTESKQAASRHVSSDRELQRLGADDQISPSPSGIVIDTDNNDDLSRQWPAEKHPKHVQPDVVPPAAPPYDRVGLTLDRPTQSLPHRRLHSSSRRRGRQRGRTKKRRQGRRKKVSASRSTSLPIDVVFRLLGSRRRRSRHRHRRGSGGTSDFSSSPAGRNQPALSRHNSLLSIQHSPSDTVSVSSDVAEVESTSTDLSLVDRKRRSLSVGQLRMSRDVDKQRQRLVLEKLLESSMSDAERAARKLTSSVLDELLGKANGVSLINLLQ